MRKLFYMMDHDGTILLQFFYGGWTLGLFVAKNCQQTFKPWSTSWSFWLDAQKKANQLRWNIMELPAWKLHPAQLQSWFLPQQLFGETIEAGWSQSRYLHAAKISKNHVLHCFAINIETFVSQRIVSDYGTRQQMATRSTSVPARTFSSLLILLVRGPLIGGCYTLL